MAGNISVAEDGRKQFIVVKIGSEQYGIDISYVDNIVRMQKITRVPKAQAYFKGIINLRGEIVPVMSIRTKMDLEPEEHGVLGLIVDEVKEVVTLGPDEIDKVAYDAKNNKSNFINGVGKHGEELISLFDTNSIIDETESV